MAREKNAPRRENRSTRRLPRSTPRARLLVVCGGNQTEPQYLRSLRDAVQSRSVDITLVRKGDRSPLGVVRHALGVRAADFDEVWCVFDVDQFDVGPAVHAAGDAVKLAVSNPCFELWLLLHHEDCRAHQPSCRAVVERLRRHVPGYDKTHLRFEDFASGVPKALVRAKDLSRDAASPPPNPSTGVWRLVAAVLGNGGEQLDGNQ